ncbi:hypothetical protein V1477_012999 [Vespula maculifrons]|uniref:Uncharacterized protein n=1 Tax=Vespula maculifrons TaxID=7453 RepID=A0ABD2BUN8_VESMC
MERKRETFLPFEEWERNGRRWRTNRKVEHPGEHSVPSVVGETTMAEFRRSDFKQDVEQAWRTHRSYFPTLESFQEV